MNHNIYDIYIDKFINVNITEENYIQLTPYDELWEDFVVGYSKTVQHSGFTLNVKFVRNDTVKQYFIRRLARYK